MTGRDPDAISADMVVMVDNQHERRRDRPRGALGPAGRLSSFAPATGQWLGEVPVATADEVHSAVARAHIARQTWSVLPIEERAERLLRLRDALVSRADEVIERIVQQTGKPRHEALAHELFVLCQRITSLTRNRPQAPSMRALIDRFKQRRTIVEHVPQGVVAVISPHDSSLLAPFSAAAEALIAGSAVVVKPSELSPLVAEFVKSIWDLCGLPVDLLQTVFGDDVVGAMLVESGVDKVVFAGRAEAARRVAMACGGRLIACSLQIQTKAPLIVADDADLERAAQAIAYGAFANCGQMHNGVATVLAGRDTYDELVDRVTEIAKELRQGDPHKQLVDVGAVCSLRHLRRAEELVADAVFRGGTLRAGGERRPGAGQLFAPTVLADCHRDMRAVNEEVVGPIAPFMAVENEERAIELVNGQRFGTLVYVFSKDLEHARHLASRIEAARVVINDVVPGSSANGRTESWSLADAAIALRFPYSERSYRWRMRTLRALYGGGTWLGHLG